MLNHQNQFFRLILIFYSSLLNCRGVKQNEPGGKLSGFLKSEGGEGLGHSVILIK